MRRGMGSGDFDFVLIIYFYEGANPSLKDNSATSPYEVADASMKTLVDVAMREREKLQDAELQKKYLIAAQKFNTKWKEV